MLYPHDVCHAYRACNRLVKSCSVLCKMATASRSRDLLLGQVQ